MAAATATDKQRGQDKITAAVRDAASLAEPGLAVRPLPPDPEDAFAAERRDEMRHRLVLADVPLIAESGRDVLSDLAFEIEAYLRSLTVPQLVCLSYGHKWPELIPGESVPKGFRAIRSPEHRGVYLVTEACTRETLRPSPKKPGLSCGTKRTSLTLPRGVFDRRHGRSYTYDDANWEVRPAGSRLTRLDFLDEILRRMGRELFPEEISA